MQPYIRSILSRVKGLMDEGSVAADVLSASRLEERASNRYYGELMAERDAIITVLVAVLDNSSTQFDERTELESVIATLRTAGRRGL